ncbi:MULTISPECIES: DUF4199 domain-containing protein [Hymenobacter]|uniref:DUF4199 domain-containing protein n=1 Tax=Hymenobacter TaxID=89966 RepID=UPI001CF59329|nr:DUF4199 domain-containing protein [Hymenobacter pini]
MKPTTSHPVLRTATLCGVVTGALCIAWFLFLYSSGNDPYGPKRMLSSFFVPIAAVISQFLLRRYYEPDGPGLRKSVGAGALTALVTALVAAVGLYAFARLTGPELIAQHVTETRQMLESTKAIYLKEANGLQQYQAILRNLATNAVGLAQDEFTKKLVIGLLLAIPGGVFLRK